MPGVRAHPGQARTTMNQYQHACTTITLHCTGIRPLVWHITGSGNLQVGSILQKVVANGLADYMTLAAYCLAYYIS